MSGEARDSTEQRSRSRERHRVCSGATIAFAAYALCAGCGRIGYDAVSGDAGVIPGAEVSIAPDDFASRLPDVVWTGTGFAIAIIDARDGRDELYLAMYDESGERVAEDVRISAGASNPEAPSLVWTGSGFAVAWADDRDVSGQDEIYLARLDSAGTKIGPDLRVTSAAGDSQAPSLAWTGSEFGVAWVDERDGNKEIYFARLSAEGAVLTETRATNDPMVSSQPDIAWSGTQFAVAWRDDRAGGEEIFFARIDAAGAKVGADLRVTDAPNDREAASVVWADEQFCITFEDNRLSTTTEQIFVVCLDGSGIPLGPALQLTDTTAKNRRPSLVWTGASFGLVWVNAGGADKEIFFKTLDPSGNELLRAIRLTDEPGVSESPTLAFSGRAFGVAYCEDRDGHPEVYFQVVTP